METNSTPEFSYTPIDCGFDLRAHPDMAIELPPGEHLRVRYMAGVDERIVEGTRDHVASTLASAGYMVSGESCEGRR